MSVSRRSLETFRASDYGQVGYLFARGFSFDQVECDRRQIFFHFTPSFVFTGASADDTSCKDSCSSELALISQGSIRNTIFPVTKKRSWSNAVNLPLSQRHRNGKVVPSAYFPEGRDNSRSKKAKIV